MMLFMKLYAGITGVVFLSILICGLWLRHYGAAPARESISFHATLGVVSIVMGLVLVILFFIKK